MKKTIFVIGAGKWLGNGVAKKFAPKNIAEEFWKLYDKREVNEIIY